MRASDPLPGVPAVHGNYPVLPENLLKSLLVILLAICFFLANFTPYFTVYWRGLLLLLRLLHAALPFFSKGHDSKPHFGKLSHANPACLWLGCSDPPTFMMLSEVGCTVTLPKHGQHCTPVPMCNETKW